ncbi:LLM class flavin-dependent oxidoreductase [Achromobacter sp. GG226]|uniref:LLM class flavin-dependent oxidoreductase n=1 Tax=Verticiella alkaliphila TaxID=2779529 RepID=UPI001C0E2882|nr:LLM class flavin-dependent oxidoreductase [Verticiella sp. GG226]MBU4611121.1 LLM class flavin-dependent oxidoreductase [Verticiella sp. GG226]
MAFPLPLSVLDLAPIVQGGTPAEAFAQTTALARLADARGYTRYWLAEHHAMPGIASAATAVLIGHVAGATERIRVGSGGIMLPNHAPLVIAEQFGTLASLYPDRIDLGLGRAPGTDQATMRALRRANTAADDDFVPLLEELRGYFRPGPDMPGWRVRAVPGEGMAVPIWLLGSSGYSAQLAGHLGLPFAFAGHFSPANIDAALQLYRQSFRRGVLDKPYAILALQVIVAPTDEEAQLLSTTQQLQVLNLARGNPAGQIPPPVEHIDFGPGEAAAVNRMLGAAIIGNPETVRAGLLEAAERTGAQEIMAVTSVFDPDLRLRSYDMLADLWAGEGG